MLVRVLSLMLVVALLLGCRSACVYDVQSAERSPNGRYDLVSYAKTCGAMVGARRGVSLVRAGTSLTEATDTRVFYYKDAAGVQPAIAA